MIRRARAVLVVFSVIQGLMLTVAAHPPARPMSPHVILPLPVVTGDPLLDNAEQVALDVLAANQQGPTHRAAPLYVTPWIRDSFAWGMVPDDRGTLSTYARDELNYWLSHQQPFGGWITFQYSGWYDETPIFIAAVLDAYRLTGDAGMVRRALPALRRGWTWLSRSYTRPEHGSRCLLWVLPLKPNGQHFAADWADQVARQGYTPQLEGLWYQASSAMAALEDLAGGRSAAGAYARTASCIVQDTNRLLWHVDAPAHRNAPPLPPFGHYHAAPAGSKYFEIDGNALLIAVGLADSKRRSSVLQMVQAQSSYLLGRTGGGPARVLYGDYAPEDYAPIHGWMGEGVYQNAYWPSVGGLLAIAAARNDDVAMATMALRGLAWRGANTTSGFHEWYRGDGTPGGAVLYGWGARMYLLALYRAYLGVDDGTDAGNPADLVLRSAPGPAQGEVVRLGHHITIVCHGAGRFRYARLGARILRSPTIPARLLYDGAVLDVYRTTK